MKTLNLNQGSELWHAERARRFTASEAPAMMGASKYLTRADLLRQKATGITPEVSRPQQAIFDRGHQTEHAARAIVEEMIGEDLFPATAVHDEMDWLLASLDGVTMLEERIFEHKLWSDDLAAQVRAGELEPHYYWQLEQQLLVTGAEYVIFVCSDGTRENFVSMEYRPVAGRREQLLAGWAQFRADLAAYVPAEPTAPAAVAAPIEALPAVSVRMEGALAVHSNLDLFAAKLRDFISRIPAKPASEQEFVDCDAACKALKRAEEALDAAEANALGQVQSVEQVTRTIADLRAIARAARLASEKTVKARKEQIRAEEVQRGRDALAAHIAELNRQIGKPYMPPVPADFSAAISGKKTVDSLRNGIDTELARAKIAANEAAGRIQVNMAALRELASEHAFLFADAAQLVLKDADACRAIVTGRITEHQAKLQREAEAAAERERAKIRAEEEARARATAAREQQERGALERQQREATEAQTRQAAQAAAPAQPPAAPVSAPPAAVSPAVVPIRPTAAPASVPTLTLGRINDRLKLCSVTAAQLDALGFTGTRDRGAVLFHEADFGRICAALVRHLEALQMQRAA